MSFKRISGQTAIRSPSRLGKTGFTNPLRLSLCALRWLPLHPRPAAFDEAFNFLEAGHAGAARRGHRHRAVGRTVVHGLLRIVKGTQSAEQAAHEMIPAAGVVEVFRFSRLGRSQNSPLFGSAGLSLFASPFISTRRVHAVTTNALEIPTNVWPIFVTAATSMCKSLSEWKAMDKRRGATR
jgi:hypothetical protein